MKKVGVVVLIATLAAATQTPTVEASPVFHAGRTETFRSCAQLNKSYKFGIALNRATSGEYPAKISRALYLKYSDLDVDGDGIACEKESLQRAASKPASPVTTVARVAAATVPSPPVPTSPQRIAWDTGGTMYLRTGVTYVIGGCLNNSATVSQLEVLTLATAWTFKAVGFRYINAEVCPDPKFPYALDWTWTVTELAGQVSKARISPWGYEMSVVIS